MTGWLCRPQMYSELWKCVVGRPLFIVRSSKPEITADCPINSCCKTTVAAHRHSFSSCTSDFTAHSKFISSSTPRVKANRHFTVPCTLPFTTQVNISVILHLDSQHTVTLSFPLLRESKLSSFYQFLYTDS